MPDLPNTITLHGLNTGLIKLFERVQEVRTSLVNDQTAAMKHLQDMMDQVHERYTNAILLLDDLTGDLAPPTPTAATEPTL